MCDVEAITPAAPADGITFDKFKKMAENLGLSASSVVLSGAGDLTQPCPGADHPLPEPAVPKLKISITTNGIALSQRLSEELLDCRLDHNI
jgi:hypothetical protein